MAAERKKPDPRQADGAEVYHADLYGLRQTKYDWLEGHDLQTTDWAELEPASRFYLFVPRDASLETVYDRFLSLPALFPVNSVGIVTARDRLTIHWTPKEVWKTVTVFCRMDP